MRKFKICKAIWSAAYRIPAKLRHKSRPPTVTPSMQAEPLLDTRIARLPFRYLGFRERGKEFQSQFKGRKAYEVL
jgi:hypothetical protein